jgi:hypothetical protein
MAATPRPCCRIASRCCSSSTSWILQNGHQSAERKNTSMAPFGPMTELRVWFRPSWSGAEKAGTCWPTSGQSVRELFHLLKFVPPRNAFLTLEVFIHPDLRNI